MPYILLAISTWLSLYFASPTLGDTIFESGTLGPTGISKNDVLAGGVLATNVNSDVFIGVRFQLTRPAEMSRIGGHFVGGFDSNSFFGSIVRLTSSSDIPDSGDLSTPDVLGQTWLSFPHPSREIFGNLSVTLEPGWYALVFGSGRFGVEGTGGAVRNGVDFGAPSYIAWQSGSTGWFEVADLSDFHVFNNHRFIVEGNFIPEPTSMFLIGAGALLITWLFTYRQRNRHQSQYRAV